MFNTSSSFPRLIDYYSFYSLVIIIIVMWLLYFGGHTLLCLKLTPGPILSDHFWIYCRAMEPSGGLGIKPMFAYYMEGKQVLYPRLSPYTSVNYFSVFE